MTAPNIDARIAQITKAIHAVDDAARAVRAAREACFAAFQGVTGEEYRKLEATMRHIDRARLALRGEPTSSTDV